jgi:hypothetical protein
MNLPRDTGGGKYIKFLPYLRFLSPVGVTVAELANAALVDWAILSMSSLSSLNGDTMAAAASPHNTFFSRNC